MEAGAGLIEAKIGGDLFQPVLADLGRSHHGAQVAVDQVGRAAVQQQELPQILADLALAVELERWQANALVPDFGRSWVEGAGRSAADIGLVRPVAGEAYPLVRVIGRRATTQSARWLPPAT